MSTTRWMLTCFLNGHDVFFTPSTIAGLPERSAECLAIDDRLASLPSGNAIVAPSSNDAATALPSCSYMSLLPSMPRIVQRSKNGSPDFGEIAEPSAARTIAIATAMIALTAVCMLRCGIDAPAFMELRARTGEMIGHHARMRQKSILC